MVLTHGRVPGWPQTYCVAQGDLELLIFLLVLLTPGLPGAGAQVGDYKY